MSPAPMVALLLLAGLVCTAAHPVPASHRRGSFMASVSKRAAPALQPSEVYDKDFPIDMAKLTPEELRYKAQADYAKAIAKLKKEAAEADAARQEMEKELKELEEAKRHAKDAADEALRAKQALERLRAEAAAADARAGGQSKEASNSTSAITKEQADYAAAQKAYEDAAATSESVKAKIAELEAKHKALCEESLKLEAERRAAMGDDGSAAVNTAASGHSQAKRELAAAEAKAKAEQAEADAAAKRSEELKAALAAAEALSSGTGGTQGELDKQVVETKKVYEEANEKYRNEQTDLEEAQKRVDRAKAELAKYEQAPLIPSFSGAGPRGVAFALLAVMCSVSVSLQ